MKLHERLSPKPEALSPDCLELIRSATDFVGQRQLSNMLHTGVFTSDLEPKFRGEPSSLIEASPFEQEVAGVLASSSSKIVLDMLNSGDDITAVRHPRAYIDLLQGGKAIVSAAGGETVGKSDGSITELRPEVVAASTYAFYVGRTALNSGKRTSGALESDLRTLKRAQPCLAEGESRKKRMEATRSATRHRRWARARIGALVLTGLTNINILYHHEIVETETAPESARLQHEIAKYDEGLTSQQRDLIDKFLSDRPAKELLKEDLSTPAAQEAVSAAKNIEPYQENLDHIKDLNRSSKLAAASILLFGGLLGEEFMRLLFFARRKQKNFVNKPAK